MENWDTKDIVGKVLEDLDRERLESRRGTYSALVPPEFQAAIEELVASNFKHYAAVFGNDRSVFKEQMARNWLVKHKAFAQLCDRSGMTRILRADAGHETPRSNEASFAILTQNASYLYAGPGAFDRVGPGAPYRYRRIPLRGEEVTNREGHHGFYFKEPPTTGRSAVTSVITTSSVVCIYRAILPIEHSRKVAANLNVALDQTFAYADSVTLCGLPKNVH
jgi:hypothetical protein